MKIFLGGRVTQVGRQGRLGRPAGTFRSAGKDAKVGRQERLGRPARTSAGSEPQTGRDGRPRWPLLEIQIIASCEATANSLSYILLIRNLTYIYSCYDKLFLLVFFRKKNLN
ncbi:hypothetical protein BpHYR1_028813 [Brachionus plicatilis]|uniref:Uncharacterized protein n=1 Tax=Brachionus plicatilis TaxID=10195 RepID=A0A3M7PDS6_BRAPC|nr:hypothetical protein BpHYR1_028813 [Brachionus plicatilis]